MSTQPWETKYLKKSIPSGRKAMNAPLLKHVYTVKEYFFLMANKKKSVGYIVSSPSW